MIISRFLNTVPISVSKLQVGRNYNKIIESESVYPYISVFPCWKSLATFIKFSFKKKKSNFYFCSILKLQDLKEFLQLIQIF